jgi:hypothetical protein
MQMKAVVTAPPTLVNAPLRMHHEAALEFDTGKGDAERPVCTGPNITDCVNPDVGVHRPRGAAGRDDYVSDRLRESRRGDGDLTLQPAVAPPLGLRPKVDRTIEASAPSVAL